MTPLESAILDLVRSMAGEATPLEILLNELWIREEFATVIHADVVAACLSLADQSKIWYDKEGVKLRHHEPKPEPQRRLF